jgi:hypothetical protein
VHNLSFDRSPNHGPPYRSQKLLTVESRFLIRTLDVGRVGDDLILVQERAEESLAH